MDIHFLYPCFIWGMFGAAWALGIAVFFLHPREQHPSPEKSRYLQAVVSQLTGFQIFDSRICNM